MINKQTTYIYFLSDFMSQYTMMDLKNMGNVKIVNKYKLFQNRILNIICKGYLSIRVNKYISLPLKKIWYKRLLCNKVKERVVVIMSPSWYDIQLINFLRKNYSNCKLVLYFHDIVAKDLRHNKQLRIEEIKKVFDQIVVYNQADSEKYGFVYHSVGYAPPLRNLLKEYPHSDLVFIGAAKDRLDIIRKVYKKMTEAGLKCDFYVTEVPKSQRRDDGIIYGDSVLPFLECLAREVASNCILEILQGQSKGRTYRMMDAIIYNKKLVTNCKEILSLPYFDENKILLFEDIQEISVDFVKNHNEINYNYKDDFSNIKFLEFIDLQ